MSDQNSRLTEDTFIDFDTPNPQEFLTPEAILSCSSTLIKPLVSEFVLHPHMSIYFRSGLDTQTIGLIPSVCAVGAFDGVHLGHRSLISSAILDAHESGSLSMAVIFDPDPARLLMPQTAPQDLLCIKDRIRFLLSLGLDAVACVAFTPEVAALSYEQFFDDYLFKLLFCKSIHVGTNFRMGAGGKGDVKALRAFTASYDTSVYAHELETAVGDTVSSTRIRALLASGSLDEATVLLRRAHIARGNVVHGRGEGTSFGFPTANIVVDEHAALPQEGVYACYVGDGKKLWPAAVNVGAPRTFGGVEGTPLLEATLLGFDGNLYGVELTVFFVTWLRAPQKFSSLEELEQTVLGNINWVRQNLGEEELHD